MSSETPYPCGFVPFGSHRWLAMILMVVMSLAGVAQVTVSAQEEGAGQAAAGEAQEAAGENGQNNGQENGSEQAEQAKPDEPEPQAQLTIGDPAPPLAIAEWVHGTPVEGFNDGHIYVVEFWATWCGPCLASMPHVSKLQEEYRDRATFVGISREETDVVKEFLGKVQDSEAEKTWADILTYSLGMDQEQQTTNTYMQAAQRFGIPCAFLVGRDGVIEWIGHPMRLDDVLAKVDQNQWDRLAFKKEYEEEQAVQGLLRKASLAIRDARSSGDWEPAIEAISEAAERLPDRPDVQMARITVLVGAKRYDVLATLVQQLREKHWEDAQFLNALSWELTTRVDPEHLDLDVALELAERANELTKGENPSVLDTVARVWFERGDLKKAIEFQTKAVEQAPGMARYKASLTRYEKALEEAEKPAAASEDTDPAEPSDEASEN